MQITSWAAIRIWPLNEPHFAEHLDPWQAPIAIFIRVIRRREFPCTSKTQLSWHYMKAKCVRARKRQLEAEDHFVKVHVSRVKHDHVEDRTWLGFDTHHLLSRDDAIRIGPWLTNAATLSPELLIVYVYIRIIIIVMIKLIRRCNRAGSSKDILHGCSKD